MKRILLILVPYLFVVGCDGGVGSILAGVGIGVGGSETLSSWEENLLEKKTVLVQQYEDVLIEMQNASDPNELVFVNEKLKSIQIAKVVNDSAIAVIQELKNPSSESENSLSLLYGLIPIAVTWGANELRKRTIETNKRQADKDGRELTLRQLAEMDDSKITASTVEKMMFENIGAARKG